MERFYIKTFSGLAYRAIHCYTLLLADIFEKLKKKCIKSYEIDTAQFLSAPALAWQVCLKKTETKCELLINIDMLQMIDKGIGAKYLIQLINMQKEIINIQKTIIQTNDANNSYGWAMSKI